MPNESSTRNYHEILLQTIKPSLLRSCFWCRENLPPPTTSAPTSPTFLSLASANQREVPWIFIVDLHLGNCLALQFINIVDKRSVFTEVCQKFKLKELYYHQKQAIDHFAYQGKDVFVNFPMIFRWYISVSQQFSISFVVRWSGHIVAFVSTLINLLIKDLVTNWSIEILV